MSGFHDRLGIATMHESRVLESVRRHGWVACLYGQGLLSEEVRSALRHIDTPIRWHPDIIAVRDRSAYMIDAKCGRADTRNYDIEKDSLRAGHDWSEHCGLSVVYVWHDGRCSFSWELLADGAPVTTMTFRGRGSGTDAWLIPKAMAHSFDDVFGVAAPAYGPLPAERMQHLRASS